MKSLSFFVLAVLLCSASQAQTLTCQARARLVGPVAADSGTDISAPSCHGRVNVAGVGLADASADVDVGVLKLDVMALNGPLSPSQADASATARWSDRFTISAPGMDNTQLGSFTFSVQLNGFLDSHSVNLAGTARNRATWFFDVNAANFKVLSRSFNTASNSWVNGESVQLGWSESLTGEAQFRFNTSTSLLAELGLNVGAPFPGNSISMAFGNSVYWAGISEVRDANGQVLSLAAPGQAPGPGQYAMSSQSGIDWTRSLVPVPEPAAAGLMTLGLVAISLLLRTRRTA